MMNVKSAEKTEQIEKFRKNYIKSQLLEIQMHELSYEICNKYGYLIIIFNIL